jgi:hypothetical protein
MIRGLGICARVVVAALCFAAATSRADLEREADAREMLRRAFENRYEIDTRLAIDLVVRGNGDREIRRRLVVATRRIDGRMHSLARFVYPEHLRGTTLLHIENGDRGDDHFVFMRSLGRMRRITSTQRADAFVGTDLSYEDLERRRIGDYEISSARWSRAAGEEVVVIEARPRFQASYSGISFVVAIRDHAILETRYTRRASEVPFKRVVTPRAHMRRVAGHTLPMRIWVENRSRGTRTDVTIERLEVDPNLEESLFTSAAIESGRPLPGLE